MRRAGDEFKKKAHTIRMNVSKRNTFSTCVCHYMDGSLQSTYSREFSYGCVATGIHGWELMSKLHEEKCFGFSEDKSAIASDDNMGWS